MTNVYTQDDVEEAPPGHLPLVGTDLELVFTRAGDDAVVHVNKGSILICRIRLQDALANMSGESLMQFSSYAPDFILKVGDTAEGMARLKRSLGLV
jgi:hypothetical protein